MSSETENGTSDTTYELTCTDCSYQDTVDGSVHDALDEAKAHEDEHEKHSTQHFVDLELVDSTA